MNQTESELPLVTTNGVSDNPQLSGRSFTSMKFIDSK